jgi:hypothetical protein
MSRSRKVTGTCHLCSDVGPLSFEHVPPRKAFNDRPVLLHKFDQVMEAGPDDILTGGKNQQKGAGAYTLCEKCNNATGSWYGKHFVDWCHQAMLILTRAGGGPSLFYLNYVFPLSILKQVVTMFASINGPTFGDSHPDLARFVLDRERKYLPPRYRFFVYFKGAGRLRQVAVAGTLNLRTHGITLSSEIAFPPLGYVMSIASDRPDPRLFEITHFARYDYGKFEVMELRLPVLPTHLTIPGDYRTRDEILKRISEGNALP